ncbi:MAG TPA: hypothetical protein DCY94_02845 [Firmicutes bacterium]|nr:hypothetical protein [Bacillota bacterium]
MKKIIFALMFFGLSISNVNAASKSCTPDQLSSGQEALATASYELTYASDYANRVGNFEEGYMRLSAKNLPSGYVMLVYTGNEYFELQDNTTFAEVRGGVHKIEYYSTACDTPIRTFEMKVPHYKLFCDVDKSCEKNVWFDGTYENSASNQNRRPREIVSLRLIIILITLILIIVLFVVITIRRRKKSEIQF